MKIIDECDNDLKGYGFKQTKHKFDIMQNYLKISNTQEQQKTGWQQGEYYIFNCPNLYLYNKTMLDYLKQLLKQKFKSLIQNINPTKILVVGLGNKEIFCDSFGVEVVNRVFATGGLDSKLFNKKIYCFCPMVQMQSGIKTTQFVKFVSKNVKADLVVLIDSLMTDNVSRLAHSFQFSSCGLTPGGGVGNIDEITSQNTNAHVFSIGVPFMMDLSCICSNIKNSVIVAPKDIKREVIKCSEIIADVLNTCFLDGLSEQDIYELKNS